MFKQTKLRNGGDVVDVETKEEKKNGLITYDNIISWQ